MTTETIHTKIGAVRDAHAAYAALLPQVEAARVARDEAQAQLTVLSKALRVAEQTLDKAQYNVTRQWRRELANVWEPGDEEMTEAPKHTWHEDWLYDEKGMLIGYVNEVTTAHAEHWGAYLHGKHLGDFIAREKAVAFLDQSVCTHRAWSRL